MASSKIEEKTAFLAIFLCFRFIQYISMASEQSKSYIHVFL